MKFGVEYSHVKIAVDGEARTATLTLLGPQQDCPESAEAVRELGSSWWPLLAFRELHDALCHLRINEEGIGLILLRTEGEIDRALAYDEVLQRHAADWFVGEVRLLVARTLRRLDLTARSIFALIEPGSCICGNPF